MSDISYYILDTNVILQSPEILAKRFHGNLLIPEAVLQELDRGGSNRWASRISALIKGSPAHLTIAPSPNSVQNELQTTDKLVQRLSGADIDIARIAISYAEKGIKVSVVTRDRWLRKFLDNRNIASFTPIEFQDIASSAPDSKIEDVATEISSEQNRYVRNSIILAAIIFGTAFFAFKYRQELSGTLSIWGTALATLIIGTLFYAYRQRGRLSYGVFEFLFGWAAALQVFWPNFDYGSLEIEKIIQIVAGLYVMVRGLDNIGKGVEKTKFEAHWLLVFKKI